MLDADDPALAGRAVDLSDVGARVLRRLLGVAPAGAALPNEPVVLVAHDLTPSDMARLDPDTLLALCTVVGGPTSPPALIARSMGIPAVVGAGAGILEHEDGVLTILDGSGGWLSAVTRGSADSPGRPSSA